MDSYLRNRNEKSDFCQIIIAIDIAYSSLNDGGLINTGNDTMRICIHHRERSWTRNSQFGYFKSGESYVIDAVLFAGIGSVRGSPSGTIGNFTNGTIGSQWYHWLTNGTNGTIWRANGTIGRTMNDIGIPLVPL